jgi:hypothetical protein
MTNTIIVATDLGAFKAYRLDRTALNTPRLELIEEMELVDGHGRLGDKVTDQAGRYSVPMQSMAMSNGERQKIELELKRRLIKQIAGRLTKLANRRDVEEIYFSAASAVNEMILEEAGPQVRGKIEKNVACNLAKLDKKELLRHFLEPEPATR